MSEMITTITILSATNNTLADINKALTDKVAELSESIAKISIDKQEGKLKRKSTEINDVESPHVELLQQKLADLRQELTIERSQAADREKALSDRHRDELQKKDEELNEALEAIVETNGKWKDKVDGFRKEVLESKAKYERLKKEHSELTKKFEKRTNGPTRFGSRPTVNFIDEDDDDNW